MVIIDELFKLQDKDYAIFQSKLTHGIPYGSFIGIRVPVLRKFAKKIAGSAEACEFTGSLPHKYYDENMLHALLISEIKDYDECILQTDRFLPYVDNWAVCDTMSPKVFSKNRQDLLCKIKQWSSSLKVYECRFGVEMLMRHFLDGDFRKEYLNIPGNIRSDEYYVNMMIAWFYATALAKQWDATIAYFENAGLDRWVQNKTVQKACESFRITQEQKKYLKKLKI
jgi:3-methyladenine DNA glycosylase AlkD